METPKTALLGRTLDEIQQIVRNLGMPKFAAKQITSWLYDKKVETIDEMTNLSLKHREALKEGYEVGASAPVEEMRSVDGTVKYLFRPAEKAFSITEIIDILHNYDFSKQRRLSFEYIVFKGVNDSLIYAKEIVKLLRGIECRVNLIRFHAIPNVDLEGVDMETMVAFRDYLTQHGVFATIRASRGEDIFAACGMLSTAKQQKEKGVTLQ